MPLPINHTNAARYTPNCFTSFARALESGSAWLNDRTIAPLTTLFFKCINRPIPGSLQSRIHWESKRTCPDPRASVSRIEGRHDQKATESTVCEEDFRTVCKAELPSSRPAVEESSAAATQREMSAALQMDPALRPRETKSEGDTTQLLSSTMASMNRLQRDAVWAEASYQQVNAEVEAWRSSNQDTQKGIGGMMFRNDSQGELPYALGAFVKARSRAKLNSVLDAAAPEVRLRLSRQKGLPNDGNAVRKVILQCLAERLLSGSERTPLEGLFDDETRQLLRSMQAAVDKACGHDGTQHWALYNVAVLKGLGGIATGWAGRQPAKTVEDVQFNQRFGQVLNELCRGVPVREGVAGDRAIAGNPRAASAAIDPLRPEFEKAWDRLVPLWRKMFASTEKPVGG